MAHALPSPYVLSLVAAAAVTAVLARHTWRDRDDPGSNSLAAFTALIAAVSLVYATALLVHGRGPRLILERVVFCFNAVLPVAWLTFALEYAGYEDLVTRRRLAALILPAAVLVALPWIDRFADLVVLEYSYREVAGLAIVNQQLGDAFWLLFGYGYVLVAVGCGVLVRFALTAPHLYKDQTASLLVAAGAPLVLGVFSIAEYTPIRGLNLSVYAFVVSALALGNAVFRDEVFESVPAARRLGRRAVTDRMDEGVLLLDENDTIVDANPVARAALADGDRLIGRPAAAVLPASGCCEESDPCTVRSADGRQLFEAGVSTVTDQHDRPVGRIVTLHEVTERRRREHRLELLARVLRHNVRNDMTVVSGHAADLARRLDGEPARRAATIRDVARGLSDIADEARNLEQLLEHSDGDGTYDAAEIVAEAIATVERSRRDVAVETDLATGARIDERALPRTIVENLVENAVEHNDGDPWIAVSVERRDGSVAVEVADDGPGIPDDDRQVLLKGTEKPLSHGSGLGLWIVHWGVETMGGEVGYSDRDGGGSVVTVTFPAVETE